MADLPTNRTLSVQEEVFLTTVRIAHKILCGALDQIGTKYKSESIDHVHDALALLDASQRSMRSKGPK